MRTQTKSLRLIISLVLFTFIACEYEDYPDPIWDENDAGSPTPTITSIDPPSLAYEGITEVTITGANYSAILTQNQVTFNGVIAEIDPTSTAAALKVTVPVVINDDALNALDSVKILVAVQGAYAGALYAQDFRVERAVIEWGGFVGELPEKKPNAVACDTDENVFVAAGDKILYKIDSTGVRTEFGTGLSTLTNDLRVGPGGFIYFTRNIPYVYRFDPAGGAAVRWHKVGARIGCLDFNSDQDIYCGGDNDSLYIVNIANEVNHGVAPAVDYVYTSLRVYDGYVYVAGEYDGSDVNVTVTQGIWRHEILPGSDTLGTKELVYDFADNSYSLDQDILSMAVNSDGLFYLGLSAGTGPAMLTLDLTSMEVQPFYDAVMTAPTTSLTWGNGNKIYCARYSASATEQNPNAVLKIAQTNISAPYYGRD